MNIRNILLAAGAVAVLAVPAAAQVVRPKISLAQAVATAESELGARAYDAEFDMDLGDMVYEIELVKNGKPVQVRVDANSGRLVHQSRPIKARLPIVGENLKAAQIAPRTLSQTIAWSRKPPRARSPRSGWSAAAAGITTRSNWSAPRTATCSSTSAPAPSRR